jgi:hypothetical protein
MSGIRVQASRGSEMICGSEEAYVTMLSGLVEEIKIFGDIRDRKQCGNENRV